MSAQVENTKKEKLVSLVIGNGGIHPIYSMSARSNGTTVLQYVLRNTNTHQVRCTLWSVSYVQGHRSESISAPCSGAKSMGRLAPVQHKWPLAKQRELPYSSWTATSFSSPWQML